MYRNRIETIFRGAPPRRLVCGAPHHFVRVGSQPPVALTVSTDNNRNETTQHVIQHVTSTVPLARRGGVGPRPLKGCRTEAGGVKLFYEKETIDLS